MAAPSFSPLAHLTLNTMKRIHIALHPTRTLLALCLLFTGVSSTPLYAQEEHPDIPLDGPAFLPTPAGSTVVAGWLAVNRVLKYSSGAYYLNYTGPWSSATNNPWAANYKADAGSYTLTSTNPAYTMNPMGSSSIYTMNTANVTLRLDATRPANETIGLLTLQVVTSYLGPTDTRDTLGALAPVLEIGGQSYAATAADFTAERDFTSLAPGSRYHGNMGGISLVTVTWDLVALGYTGSYESFSVDFGLPIVHSAIYDAQLSVNPVPEPGAWFAILSGAGLLGWRIRRHTKPSL